MPIFLRVHERRDPLPMAAGSSDGDMASMRVVIGGCLMFHWVRLPVACAFLFVSVIPGDYWERQALEYYMPQSNMLFGMSIPGALELVGWLFCGVVTLVAIALSKKHRLVVGIVMLFFMLLAGGIGSYIHYKEAGYYEMALTMRDRHRENWEEARPEWGYGVDDHLDFYLDLKGLIFAYEEAVGIPPTDPPLRGTEQKWRSGWQ